MTQPSERRSPSPHTPAWHDAATLALIEEGHTPDTARRAVQIVARAMTRTALDAMAAASPDARLEACGLISRDATRVIIDRQIEDFERRCRGLTPEPTPPAGDSQPHIDPDKEIAARAKVTVHYSPSDNASDLHGILTRGGLACGEALLQAIKEITPARRAARPKAAGPDGPNRPSGREGGQDR